MPNMFRLRRRSVTVVLRDPHPVSVYQATALGQIYGRAIAGHNGAFRYGTAGLASQMTSFKGYVAPPQMFIGWNPKRVAGGAIRVHPSQLPTTSPSDPTDNPLRNAVNAINAGSGNGY
jgi:hypothetical protein